MKHRLLLACVLTASTAVALLANHPATFVMRSGERIDGYLSYRNGTTYTTLRGRDVDSREVAVVEFVNDDPSADELRQISRLDNSTSALERHVFVTRNGRMMVGRIYRFSRDGERVTFDVREGGRRTVSANDLARIYINPAGARSVYNTGRYGGRQGRSDWPGNNGRFDRPYTDGRDDRQGFNGRDDRQGTNDRNPQGRNDRQGGANNGGFGNNRGGGITVNGNQPWTDTGTDVRKGESISFSATGQVHIANGDSPDVVADPNGAGRFSAPRNNYPYPGMAVGGLIARVGNDKPFAIGTITNPISMPDNGRLFLGINDDGFGDNTGAFNVTISRSSR